MIPLIFGAGFVIMLLLGTITISEIRSLGKKKEQTPAKKETVKSTDKKTGADSPKRSFFSSIKSLGSAFKRSGKSKKKEGFIDQSPGKTGSGNIKGAATASPNKDTDTGVPIKGGSSGPSSGISAQDPGAGLPVSGDEFDADLLNGLEDQDPFSSLSASQDVSPGAGNVPSGDSGMSQPSLDIDSVANDILKQGADAEGLDAFEGLPDLSKLGEGDAPDQDFGDLDGLSLDDIDLDDGMDEATPDTAQNAKPTEDTSKSSSSASKPTSVKTDWVKTDAPLKMDKEFEQESTQTDMLAFAGGATGDEDLLSSLSTDVKRVTKKVDASLLRDLKDFQAPATDVETELLELYNRLNAIKKPEKQSPSATKGIK